MRVRPRPATLPRQAERQMRALRFAGRVLRLRSSNATSMLISESLVATSTAQLTEPAELRLGFQLGSLDHQLFQLRFPLVAVISRQFGELDLVGRDNLLH